MIEIIILLFGAIVVGMVVPIFMIGLTAFLEVMRRK